MTNFFVIVAYGFFSGCSGPVTGMMPDPDKLRYLYQVQLICHGRHDQIYDHDRIHFVQAWLPAKVLEVKK